MLGRCEWVIANRIEERNRLEKCSLKQQGRYATTCLKRKHFLKLLTGKQQCELTESQLFQTLKAQEAALSDMEEKDEMDIADRGGTVKLDVHLKAQNSLKKYVC